MPIDTHAAFSSIMKNADDLIAKTASRVAKSPLAKVAQSKTAERIAAIDEAVAATAVDAATALNKLAALERAKTAARIEKVAITRHIARVAQRLLAN